VTSLDYAQVADFHGAQLHFITLRERSKWCKASWSASFFLGLWRW